MRTPRAMSVLGILLVPIATLSTTGFAQRGTGLSIADVTHQEGTGGSDAFLFRISVVRDTSKAAQQVSVLVSAASGTARVGPGPACQPGDDVVFQQQLATIPSNQTSTTVSVTICTDSVDEDDTETFTLNLLNPLGATIADGQAIGTIIDDDPMPSLRVNDVFSAEGNPGSPGSATFSITMSAASGRTVSVVYNTQAGTAIGAAGCGGNADFVSSNAMVVFNPGVTQQPVVISYCGDGAFESNETFTLVLSSAQNATIADGSGSGRIDNDDQQSVIAVSAPLTQVRAEGTLTTTAGTLVITNSAAQPAALSVSVAVTGTVVVGATCTGAVDVALATPITVQWGPNDIASKTVNYTICGDDSDDEDVETLTLTLTSPTGGAAIAPTANSMTLSITDDDASPTISVLSANVTEPSSPLGVSKATVTITLSAPSNRVVSFTAAAKELITRQANGIATATGGASCVGQADFVPTQRNMSFALRETSKTLSVDVCGDARHEGTAGTPLYGKEVFQVEVSAPNCATLANPIGYVVISDP